MNPKEFEEYLTGRYCKEIEWYDKKAILNNYAYKILEFTLIVLSAITPVLIVIGGGLLEWALVLSVLVTIETSVLKVFKFYENWINYRTTCETLKKELHYYKAKIDDYKDVEDPEAMFVNRVEALISREHSLWLMSRKRKETAIGKV